ncbi:MAG: hypothetical protein DWQ09_15995 [Proteobacteria bacterium]|nr:MAG: hypothetical protein DWQ09_15995 [Pseudomonadota bacterium]
MERDALGRLLGLLGQPTAPFREMWVAAEVERQLSEKRVPFFTDPHGNRVVGVRSAREYRALVRSSVAEPLRFFIAHMDHPGFHGLRWRDERTLAVRWYGGGPVRHLRGARVWLASDTAQLGEGRIIATQLAKSGRSLERAEIRVNDPALEQHAGRATRIFGGLDFRAPVWRSGKRLHTRVADDLVGVHVIVEMAREIHATRRKSPAPFIGLLTRGEEVGYVGAIRHLELGWLERARRPLLAVSLEASRTLPGAEIGKGPVVRLGDRRTVFSATALQQLTEMAAKILPKRHQRRLMDGGACEASAAMAWEIPTVGISVPLGNYHNQGFEGGPDCVKANGPAPEFVHLDDVGDTLRLCRALVECPLADTHPWQAVRQRMQRNADRYRRQLANLI